MRRIAAIVAVSVFVAWAGAASFAQQSLESSPAQIVVESQQALDRGDVKTAQRLVQEGLSRFPDQESLRIQLARVYIYQRSDAQATDLLKSVLRSNPASRDARLELAHLYGYR